MDRFAWRPAPLRGERTLTVTAGGFATDDGPLTRWAAVEAVSFALDRHRGGLMMTLRLRAGGQDMLLSVNGQGPEIARYVAMLRALVGGLAAARPDLTMTLGHEGGARMAMFGVGALGVLVGLFGIGAGITLMTRGQWADGPGLVLVGAVLGLGCAALAAGNRPGRKRPPQALPDFLAQLSLPDS